MRGRKADKLHRDLPTGKKRHLMGLKSLDLNGNTVLVTGGNSGLGLGMPKGWLKLELMFAYKV